MVNGAVPGEFCADRRIVLPVLRATADIGFVGLHNPVCAADRAAIVADAEIGHCLANPMSEEPCGFHSALEGALKLASADSLFAGAHQIDCLEPYAQRDVARLHDGADLDRERLAASVTLA